MCFTSYKGSFDEPGDDYLEQLCFSDLVRCQVPSASAVRS